MAEPIDADRLYREGVAAIQAGDRAAGRQRLAQLLKAHPRHADAWFWLSAAVESDRERIFCLEKALTVDPNHAAARQRLADLTGAPAPPEPEPEPEPERPVTAPQEPGPSPRAGPDESWRQTFADGTWESPDDEEWGVAVGEEVEPEPEPDAGPDESWLQPAADRTWQAAAGEGVEPEAEPDAGPDESWRQPTTDGTWKPATPGKEAWMGRAAVEQEQGSDPTAPSKPEIDERESWRAALYESQPEPDEVEHKRGRKRGRKRVRPDPSALKIVDQPAGPIDYGILDLLDAWAQALIFRVRGAYEATVRHGGFGYTALTLVTAGILSAITSVLMFQLVIAPLGGIQGIVARFAMLEEATPEALTLMAQFFSGLGIWIAAFAFVQAVFGRLLYGLAVHVVARLFGGDGTLKGTLSAISLATISRSILTLIPVLLLVFALLLSLPGGLAMGIGGVLYLGWIAYAWVAEVTAIRTAHPSLSVLEAVGVVIALAVVLSLFICCLSFGAGALGASGPS